MFCLCQMPKKPAVDRDSILTVLCSSKEAIVKNGNIATLNQNIWTELSEQLENKIAAKALHTFVKLNRHNIWTAFGFTHESDNETSGSSDDTDFEPGTFPPDQKIAGLLILKFYFRNGLNVCLKQFNTKTSSLKHKKGNTQF